jgi:hypothetical protein
VMKSFNNVSLNLVLRGCGGIGRRVSLRGW